MKKEWIFRIILVLGSVLITLLILSLIFRAAPDTETLHVSDISYNDGINLANKAYANNNPFGFTDRPRQVEKPKGVYRIAVLGDSFIWGDGLPHEQIWSHKLEQKLHAYCDSIEVMSWGINGWQTHDEFNFYATEGYKFKPDLLILGYVDNDPDMGDYHHMDPHFREKYEFFYRIAPALTSRILEGMYERSYGRWADKINSPANLVKYSALLDSFNTRLDADSLDHFVVLTPSCVGYGCEQYYELVHPILAGAGFEYIDVFQAAHDQLDSIPYEKLVANPANYHPGPLMTEVFAEEVYQYILKTRKLPCQSTVTEP